MIPLEEALKHPKYTQIPETILTDIYAYVEIGQPPGGFLRAVLENDLVQSFARADANSASAMIMICTFLYSEVRQDCFGDRDTVRNWLTFKAEERAMQRITSDTAKIMELISGTKL